MAFGWYFVRISSESFTRDVAYRYLDAWTSGDLDGVRRLLADDGRVESNVGAPGSAGGLGSPVRQVDALGQLAPYLVKVDLITEVYDATRAILMYDCLVREPAGAIRVVDYLDVDSGAIHRIRRVYDVAALRRLLPEFGA